MKKQLTYFMSLLCLLVCGASNAWADTETPGNTGSSNQSVVGKSYTIDGAYVAGGGGVQQGNMKSKGIKLRTNQSSKLIIKVNAGYKINSASIYLACNTTTTVDVASVTVDGVDQNITSGTIPAKGASTSFDIVLNNIDATDNITINFENGSAQIVGDFHFEYTQEQVVLAEISSVEIGGVAISAEDLAILKSEKTLTVDASSFNGLPTVVPTIENGATTVTCSFVDGIATYSFTINGDETYTVKLTGVAKTYTKVGKVIAYKEGSTEAEGVNSSSVTMNGISFTMVNTSKTFQYGSGSVTLGGKEYQPLKLSTGSAVNVVFPEGYVATKVVVYGWSANNNGKLYSFKESEDSEKSVDVSNDIFYSGNNSYDKYPSVYVYELDEWESAYFNPGGSPSQPFVVMDFVLVKKAVTSVVNSEVGYGTFYSNQARTIPANTKAYTGVLGDGVLTLTEIEGGVIPASTAVVISGEGGDFVYYSTGATFAGKNDLQGTATAIATSSVTGGTVCVLGYKDGKAGFYGYSGETLGANKAYLVVPATGASKISIVFDDEATGINQAIDSSSFENQDCYNLAGQKVSADFCGIVIKNGKKICVK